MSLTTAPTISSTVANPAGTFSFAIGATFLAFIIYITARGELPKYLSFFSLSFAGGIAAAPTAAAVASGAAAPVVGAGIIPGFPGLSLNPFAGLPGLGPANTPAATSVPGGQSNPSTGANVGLGN